MRALFTRILLVLALAGALPRAQAFSLLGALDTWMTAELGYGLGADIGGPMNLGEEYRWNMPLVTYGFDESFLNYFGTKGVEEVEKAIQIINDLPPVSQMSAGLSEFPLDTRRINYRANALFLYDLKSQTLSSLLEILGVAPAERYVWTLRSRTVINNIPWYVVLKRNFDPITFEPTAYVNGVLYTYQILQTYTTPTYEAVEFDVDPSMPSVSSVSSYNIYGGTVYASGIYATLGTGLFYTGLTRDDVAALRYMYRSENYNVESIAAAASLAPTGTPSGNYVLSNSSPGGANGWGAPGGTTVTGTNALPAVGTALRPGVDKVNFVRVDYDSMLGTWSTVTNLYQDHYITNYTQRSQMLQRTLAAPDILFSAADLGISAAGTPFVYAHSLSLLSQEALNGTTVLSGPGLIQPQATVTFSKLGSYLVNAGDGGEADADSDFYWGSYDGTTAEPVVYPSGASITNLEHLVLTGHVNDRTQNPWLAPVVVTTNTATTGTGDTTGTGTGTGGTTP